MGLADSDLLLWVGDTNYRIDATYDAAVAAVARGAEGLRELRRLDQCRRERMAGRTFKGMREGVLRFPPTYKFDKGASSRLAYDSSEKHRIPAWCDRVLWADASGGADPGADSDGDGDGGVAGTLHVVAAALERRAPGPASAPHLSPCVPCSSDTRAQLCSRAPPCTNTCATTLCRCSVAYPICSLPQPLSVLFACPLVRVSAGTSPCPR